MIGMIGLDQAPDGDQMPDGAMGVIRRRMEQLYMIVVTLNVYVMIEKIFYDRNDLEHICYDYTWNTSHQANHAKLVCSYINLGSPLACTAVHM
jgi:hypothetical protein